MTFSNRYPLLTSHPNDINIEAYSMNALDVVTPV